LDYGVVLRRQSETSTKCSCLKTGAGYVSSLKEIVNECIGEDN
jgi:hypothetical protein